MLSRFPRSSLFYFALVVVLGLIFWFTWTSIQNSQNQSDWTYTQLIDHAKDHQVSDLEINGTDGIAAETGGKKHNVVLPDCSSGCSQLLTEMQTDGVNVKFDKNSGSSYLISVLLPNIILVILIAAFMWWVLRQTQSGNNQAISFGRSRARMIAGDKPAITFADVAGVDEAKQELTEIVEFLKYPEKFVALGARIPKGVLLVGPPGTGKTLLSKAVAGEAGVPFFSISGSEFVEMFVGVGASRVRDLFDQAKKNSPCIVFVDEIDAVGRQRGAGLGGGHDEREQTLNQLLVEMDGFDTNTHVIVIAATNRPDVLDPALLRPGRFDRHVTLDRPDIKGRRSILDVHARNKPLDSTVDLDVLARQTPGFSGADLANLINEAAILAARANKKVIGMDELEEAIARVIAGPERKSRRISDKEKEVIAYHETGHALVMKALPHTDPVHKISIISRGMALGWTLSLPEEDKYLVSRDELMDQIAGIMGGRVAEEIVFGDITSGAENDIQKATQIARRMVTQWGMSDKLGNVQMGHREELVFLGRDLGEQRTYSEEVAAIIDEEIRSIVDHGYQTAKSVLTKSRSKMDAVVERLKIVETIDGKELDQILAGEEPRSPAAAGSSAG
ncbi:MAG: ATP-dependent metallopeptidase FtsH/Yme1/Tma family protein [Chloroflexi bacterium]|nr:MAG: ATP-dependent metallopeptidase FtsH/Yme1/Tma family protein [Chloroflexota bacterium]TMG06278.1 MAG: ATP-dependent metallopeptidase FtsH/Yme1/Tma family protein [Chloroflexota bacterium]TMG21551.1 MAG: ATP-dependent metallopeptidase FtsH/Yme1/Tma family protein [Chloroflexota bacterium]TMG68403.1 MAG: ATP-dependent metallopeptidase FtsH/Yme1/Tma family protein [Chloroflexota bacterium]